MKCRTLLALVALFFAPQGVLAQTGELPELSLSITGHEFRVQGGTPGTLCTVLVGFERQRVALPGGAELLIRPLAMLPVMRFDELGEYSVVIGYDAKMLQPLAYHFQALALKHVGFRTSAVQTLDFSDLRPPAASGHRTGP